MKKALVWALAAVLTATVACSKDSTGPGTPVATLLVVTSPQTNITVNGSVQLVATVYDQKGKAIPTATVQWQSMIAPLLAPAVALSMTC